MSRRAPLIGVSTSITVGAHPERAYVNSTYLHAVQQAGGVPVALPPQLSPASMRQLAAELDGLLLTGGGDLDPALFDETPHATLYDVAPSRDTLETAVLHVALERGRPVLAVCRGLQVLNVALGGSLYQDVGTDPGTQVLHSQTERSEEHTSNSSHGYISYAVFCLKKKKKKKDNITPIKKKEKKQDNHIQTENT